ncbi:hypothetical protein AB1L30_26295 [Bremerella sp. JC817]|uniref:TadE/TadG family type IV pilus assembly protein n=1 Tax=Bremerella sp. JC817 TaxID=3231756 RepID=UPI0034577BF2
MMNFERRLSFLSQRARRGVSLLWLLIAFPALLLFLVFAVEIGNIWLARLELEQSLEANALAAVKRWAETGGGDTLAARQFGNQFSINNPVRGVPVSLTDMTLNSAFTNGTNQLNYNAANINDNFYCTDISDYDDFEQPGVMVFGAITNLDGAPNTVTFNAGVEPSCSNGSVLVDASGSGQLKSGNSNQWGISYRATASSISGNRRITMIEIDVDPSLWYDGVSSTGYVFPLNTAQTSNATTGNYAITYSGGSLPLTQPDNFFYASASGGTFVSRSVVVNYSYDHATITPGTPPNPYHILRMEFQGSDGVDALKPGERFRFGAAVSASLGSSSQVDGDGLAGIAEIRVYYNGDTSNPEVGTLIDDTTGGASGQCRKRAEERDNAGPVLDALGLRHVVPHELPIMDLPCPPTSSAGNNGQSWVEIGSGVNGNYFAVRTQATIGVESVVKSLGGFNLGPWGVSAKATAYFNCDEDDARLIRVDIFRCAP